MGVELYELEETLKLFKEALEKAIKDGGVDFFEYLSLDFVDEKFDKKNSRQIKNILYEHIEKLMNVYDQLWTKIPVGAYKTIEQYDQKNRKYLHYIYFKGSDKMFHRLQLPFSSNISRSHREEINYQAIDLINGHTYSIDQIEELIKNSGLLIEDFGYKNNGNSNIQFIDERYLFLQLMTYANKKDLEQKESNKQKVTEAIKNAII